MSASWLFQYGRGVAAASLALVGLLSGCTARNLHRGFTPKNPPLQRTLTWATHHTLLEAGTIQTSFGTPVINDDFIFLPSENEGLSKGLKCLDRLDQKVHWTFAVQNGVSSQPVLVDDVVYFGANDGHFYALHADSGRVLWTYDTKAPVYGKALITGGRVYFQSADDVLYALEAPTGKWLWHYKRNRPQNASIRGNATPVLSGSRILSGFSDGYFVALNAKDGNLLWETSLGSGTKFIDVDAEAVVDDSHILTPSYDGHFYSLDAASGKVQWKADIGSTKRPILDTSDTGRLFLAGSDGMIYALRKDSGKVEWSFELDSGTPTELVLHQSYLVFGSSRSYFYAIHKGNGELAYRFNAGHRSGFFGNPVDAGKQVYILSNFGNLYGFDWKL